MYKDKDNHSSDLEASGAYSKSEHEHNHNHGRHHHGTENSISSDTQTHTFQMDDSDMLQKKNEYKVDEVKRGDVQNTKMKRELKARHVTMIALGGTIGSGLLINLSSPLTYSGPVNSLIAYLFLGSIVYCITQSLGEMATFIPVTSSFTVFNSRFLSRPLGVSQGLMYFYNWAITFAVEISVVGQVIQFWTDAVPLAAWITIFWVLITAVNFFPVRFYGEIEFWVASIKVITIVGFIFYAFIIVVGGGPDGPIGFRYWRNPGPWGPGHIYVGTAKGRFLGWVSSLINASFTYQGSETFALAVGETKNPRKTVPRAINKVFFRILLFYIGSLFFVGLLVPYNDERLASSASYIASSPFIIAIENAKTPILPHIFNAVIVTTVVSAANSNIYVGSRILYGLASNDNAPAFFKKCTAQGVPYWGVLATSAFGSLAFMVCADNAAEGFNWLVNISTVAGLIAWFFIALCHIRFMQCLRSRGISRDDLPYKAKLMPYGAYFSAICVATIIFVQGYEVFIDFQIEKFFINYISLILAVVLWIGCQFYFKGPLLLPLDDMDIDSDRREIDDIIWEDDEPKNLWEKFWAIIS